MEAGGGLSGAARSPSRGPGRGRDPCSPWARERRSPGRKAVPWATTNYSSQALGAPGGPGRPAAWRDAGRGRSGLPAPAWVPPARRFSQGRCRSRPPCPAPPAPRLACCAPYISLVQALVLHCFLSKRKSHSKLHILLKIVIP